MASEVTIGTLKQYLERFGWKHYQARDEPEEKEGIIYTGWHSPAMDDPFRLLIDPMVERKCLAFRVVEVAKAPMDSTPPDRLADLLLLLSWVNYHVILGKLSYDVSDGEIRLSIDVPIDENTFTFEQFEHSLRVIMNVAETWSQNLNLLLKGEAQMKDLLLEDVQKSGAPEKLRAAVAETLERWEGWGGSYEPLTEV
jgi:hypothetical protein